MNYSDIQLSQIEKMASIFLPVSDIAIVLNIDAQILRADINSIDNPVHNAYLKGKTSSKMKLRSQEMLLAQVGSPLALQNCNNALLDMEDDE